MNEYLQNQIKQDFVILKTFLSDNYKLAQYLRIDFADGSKVIDLLKISKENAHIELKRNYINQIFAILDDALYKMITPGKLNEALKTVDILIFLTCVNIRAISQKQVIKVKSADTFDIEEFDIKTIIKELPILSKELPDANMHIRVITNLLKKYRDITIEMDEKTILAPEKTRESITNTYKSELATVIISIKKHYYNMVMAIPSLKTKFEAQYITKKPDTDDTKDVFFTYDFTLLKHFLLKQLGEYSKIRSSLTFVKKESMDVLSIIKDLYNLQTSYIEITKHEESAIFNVMSVNKIGVEKFNLFLFRITDEIIKYIEQKFVNPYSRK